MSVAAIEVQTFDRCLRSVILSEARDQPGNNGVVAFMQQFQQAIARDIKTPWLLSTGEDLRFPRTEGKRSLSIRLLNRYMRRVIELPESNPRMSATLLRVRNLLKPLSTLFQTCIILAVLRQELAAMRRQPLCDSTASEGNAPVYGSYESHIAKYKKEDILIEKQGEIEWTSLS